MQQTGLGADFVHLTVFVHFGKVNQGSTNSLSRPSNRDFSLGCVFVLVEQRGLSHLDCNAPEKEVEMGHKKSFLAALNY